MLKWEKQQFIRKGSSNVNPVWCNITIQMRCLSLELVESIDMVTDHKTNKQANTKTMRLQVAGDQNVIGEVQPGELFQSCDQTAISV